MGEIAMLAGLYQSAVTLLLAVAFYTQDIYLIRRFDPDRVAGSARSWSWTLFAVLLASVVVLQPVLWPELGLYTSSALGLMVQFLGVLLMAGGLALHWWARLHLRQFFGERVEFQSGQWLVESGPYAYVRHPIYTAFFLCVIGLLLVNPALTTLLVVCYFLADFSRAARQEEALLSAELPGYDEYMRRTSRYVPRLRQILRSGG
ncbi:MAG: isoprenylcysteine carboxylmethyltransferase family protein [Anaerolineae bacterium]|jgi:protein-S-isoprenylcysteine O-methyltransferase Ste14